MKFFKRFAGLLGATALLLSGCATSRQGNHIPPDCKTGEFFVSGNCWTFHTLTVFESIANTAALGLPLIELHPGQKLSPKEPDVVFDHNASEATIQKVKDQLAKYHVRAINYGVVYSKGGGEAEWRKIFEFAKKMGFYAMTTESVQDLNIIEKMVREYDIRIGIHEHFKRADKPDYKVWDPNYVLSLVKDRDPRIGACADTGHWATSGLQPLDCIKLLHGRIISLHLKDRREIGKNLPDTVYGTGVSDIKGILDELKRQNFQGNISLEYENKSDHLMDNLKQCVEFIRQYSAANP